MEPDDNFQFQSDHRRDKDQRDELISLQQSLLWVVKVIGGAALIAIVSGVFVAVADHYKLSAVEQAVASLTLATNKATDDARIRNESIATWRAGVDVEMVDQRARTLALDSRVGTLESELRQDSKRAGEQRP